MVENKIRVTELGEKDKQFLKNKTPSTLPTNPSDKGWSAAQIKMKMFEGYLVLFEWLKKLTKEVNLVADQMDASQNQELSSMREEIQKISEDMEDLVNQTTAIYDEDGNRIKSTYLKAENEEYVIPEEDT